MNLVGTVLAGRYEIVQEIGSGGMAIVYKAKCRILNRYVAIKVLRTDLKDDGEFVRRFNIEAQAAASLTHSNIVSIYDVGTEGDLHYIVMEYVEGITLKDYIDKNILLNWHEAVGYAIQIACGLEQAHKNSIVHRDIKPHNIIMTHDGVLKITDFGIARASVQSTVTCEDTAIGSVHYVSPEQARGGYVDERSDIYSLGIVLYEMLTGKVPFDNESPVSIALMHLQTPPTPPREHNISIPKDVEDIVLKAMSKELSGRYKTISDFKNDLTAVAESGIPTAVPASNDSETSDVDDLGGTAIFTAAKDISIPYENNQEPSAKSNLIPSDALEHESAPDIEIIDASGRYLSKKHIQSECQHAKYAKSGDRQAIVGHGFAAAVGKTEIQTDEHKEHMPNKGVECQRPIFMNDSGRLNKCHQSTQKIEGHHEVVHTLLHLAGFQHGRNDTQIHGHAAKLEGEDPPLISTAADVVIVKQLLVDFCDHQENAAAHEQNAVALITQFAQLPCQQKRQQQTDKGKGQVKSAVSSRALHWPCGDLHQLI